MSPDPETATPDREAVFQTVTEVITEILPTVAADRVTGRRRLADLGADSVDRVEIVVGVLDRLGLQTPMAAFAAVPDLDAMTDLLTQLLREGSTP